MGAGRWWRHTFSVTFSVSVAYIRICTWKFSSKYTAVRILKIHVDQLCHYIRKPVGVSTRSHLMYIVKIRRINLWASIVCTVGGGVGVGGGRTTEDNFSVVWLSHCSPAVAAAPPALWSSCTPVFLFGLGEVCIGMAPFGSAPSSCWVRAAQRRKCPVFVRLSRD